MSTQGIEPRFSDTYSDVLAITPGGFILNHYISIISIISILLIKVFPYAALLNFQPIIQRSYQLITIILYYK
jgi:hypothetical protein